MPRRAAASPTLAVALALAASAGCQGGQGVHGPSPPTGSLPSICSSATGASMPRVFIGPDVSLRLLCAERTRAPVASVDELGSGVTPWSVTLEGDSAFALDSLFFASCQASGPQVAFVELAPPANAAPGTSFDAVVTVHADDGSFADGTVKVHGEIATPTITASRTVFDFGDLAPGDVAASGLDFGVANGVKVAISLDEAVPAPFYVTPLDSAQGGSTMTPPAAVFNWRVSFASDVPGDYAATAAIRAMPTDPPDLPAACGWTKTITMHARVMADAGARDGAASDGGPSDAPSTDGGSDDS